MASGWTLGVAAARDLERLLEIERECSSHPWTAAQLQDALDPERGTILVLHDVDGAIAAFCAFQVVLDELHIHNLAVKTAFRRRGCARRLLDACLEQGASRGARLAFLEVRAGNAAAHALYSGSGFVPAGRRRDYYSEPTEDALLLVRHLARAAPPDGRNSR